MNLESPSLNVFLDEVAAHLPPEERDDVLLELESHVLDRAEEESGGETEESAIASVVASLGEPSRVAASYGSARYLIGPGQYRPFIVYTAILYAVHLLLIGVGSLLGAESRLAPVSIRDGNGIVDIAGIAAIAIHALLFDVGLMIVIFTTGSRLSRRTTVPSVVFSVRRPARVSVARALLGVILLVALNVVENRLFVVHGIDGARSLLSHSFFTWRPWIDAFLVALIIKEGLHVARGESRLTLRLDLALGLIGVGLFLALVAANSLLVVPASVGSIGERAPVGFLVARLLQLLWIVLAATFAVGVIQRVVRLRSIRRATCRRNGLGIRV